MRHLASAWPITRFRLAATVALCLNAAGCFYSRERMSFHVTDSETGAPIPGARVGVAHQRPWGPWFGGPPDMVRKTGPDGRTELLVDLGWSPYICFSGPGYYSDCGSPDDRDDWPFDPCPDQQPLCYEVPLDPDPPTKR